MPLQSAPVTKTDSQVKAPDDDSIRYLVSDSRAAIMLKGEPACKLIKAEQEIEGYELYIVEQWACERKLNTVVTTFTGNSEHKIIASVIELPKNNKSWSARTTEYYEELTRLHLRPKDTEYGYLYVTNLSSFPSNLNLVPVPNGENIRRAWDLFYANENLKRSGCGGRLVLTIAPPPDACEDKFRQLFRTHYSVPIVFAVKELVTLVQIGLFYCNMLVPDYVDGLMCNETIKGISAWWDKYGQARHHTKPPSKDSMFGPTSVAAIVGFVMGIKLRVSSVIGYNKSPKDPFDAVFFVESIRQFQKHEHLVKTGRINEETEERLHSLKDYKIYGTAAVDLIGIAKKTMKEVQGKQVLNLAEIETCELDKLVSNLHGARARYLWLGKGTRREPVSYGFYDRMTGIPLSSLSPSDLSTSGTGRDLRKAMIRSVTAQRRSDGKPYKSKYGSDQEYDSDVERSAPSSALHSRTTSSAHVATPLHSENMAYQLSNSFVSPKHSEPTKRERGRAKLKRYMNLASTGDQPQPQQQQLAPTAYHETSSYSPQNRQRRAHSHWLTSDESRGNTDDEYGNGGLSDIDVMSDGEDGYRRQSDSPAPQATAAALAAAGKPCGLRRQFSVDSLVDPAQDAHAKLFRQYELRRSHSFSLVSGVVLRWTLPFYSDQKLCDDMGNSTRHAMLVEQDLCDMNTISLAVDNAVQVSAQRLAQNYDTVDEISSKMDQVHADERRVKAIFSDVEAMSARLKYEARMLDAKLRDVEDSVETFIQKVTNLESRMDRIVNKSAKKERPVRRGSWAE